MKSARQALPVQAMVLTSQTKLSELYDWRPATVCRAALRVIGNPADAAECGDDGKTEHLPLNSDHFKEN